ncbi:MAG: hypothetical protein ACLVGI_04320 [Evtepia sp.]
MVNLLDDGVVLDKESGAARHGKVQVNGSGAGKPRFIGLSIYFWRSIEKLVQSFVCLHYNASISTDF